MLNLDYVYTGINEYDNWTIKEWHILCLGFKLDMRTKM